MYKGNIYELVERIGKEQSLPLYLWNKGKVACDVFFGTCTHDLHDNDDLPQELREFCKWVKEFIADPPVWVNKMKEDHKSVNEKGEEDE